MTEDALNGKQTLKCLKLSRLHLLTSPEAQNIYINANQSTHTRIKKTCSEIEQPRGFLASLCTRSLGSWKGSLETKTISGK